MAGFNEAVEHVVRPRSEGRMGTGFRWVVGAAMARVVRLEDVSGQWLDRGLQSELELAPPRMAFFVGGLQLASGLRRECDVAVRW